MKFKYYVKVLLCLLIVLTFHSCNKSYESNKSYENNKANDALENSLPTDAEHTQSVKLDEIDYAEVEDDVLKKLRYQFQNSDKLEKFSSYIRYYGKTVDETKVCAYCGIHADAMREDRVKIDQASRVSKSMTAKAVFDLIGNPHWNRVVTVNSYSSRCSTSYDCLYLLADGRILSISYIPSEAEGKEGILPPTTDRSIYSDNSIVGKISYYTLEELGVS